MASELTAADCSKRLADQLQVLSEVAETLTFRLLDLEERLVAQEHQIQPFLEGGSAPSSLVAADTELRLTETEERLARLEGLLHGRELPDAARHLHSVAAVETQPDLPLDGPSEDLEFSEEAFLEEQEQAFMDELSA